MRQVTACGATGHARRGLRALLLLFTLTALFATATPPSSAADDTRHTDQAAYLAQQLRRSPVHITDQVPREVPRSMAPRLAAEAERTGVPTYVMLLPYFSAHDGEALLDAVHDRLGRDGLYVLLDEMGVAEATSYGVKAPADDAVTAASYELPYDAGALLSFRRFTEVVALDPAQAAERADAAREKYGDGNEPDDMYISHTDRENQSFLTGLLLGGVPASILLLTPFVRRWRRRLPGAAPARMGTGGRRTAVWVTLGPALAGAAVVAVTAVLLFDETRTSGAPAPNAADRSARVERVAAGLRQDPVYTDPESPRVLDDRDLARLHDRIRAFARSQGGGPVFVSVVPTLSEDESEGDRELFAAAVHHRVGKDGVYVVADPLVGTVDAFNHGLRLDSWHLFLDLPDTITLGDDAANEADDHDLGRRLDALMTFLDKSPRTDAPESLSDPVPASDPRKETTLAPLFSGDFWAGLIVGGLAGLLLLGLVAPVLLLVRKVLWRRNPQPLPTEALPYVQPADPTESDLRLAARQELRFLERALAEVDEPLPDLALECHAAARALIPGAAPDRLPDATPADLVAFVVLARVGRWAAEGESVDRVCGVNPLHGPAVNRRHVRVSARSNDRRMLPVCPLCLDAATEAGAIARLVLTLPGPADRMPYFEADGPLPAVGDGITALLRRVREPSAAG